MVEVLHLQILDFNELQDMSQMTPQLQDFELKFEVIIEELATKHETMEIKLMETADRHLVPLLNLGGFVMEVV